MTDFHSNAYTLFTGLFAAIFGMSFPLILQCIQRIDEKYDSSVISRVFDKESTYRWFKYLLWPYIILACASPLLLSVWSNNDDVLYWYQCFMLLYILAIAVVMVMLFTRITTYYNMDKLLDSYNLTNPNQDVLFYFDLAKYATKKGYQESYIKAMSMVAGCFRQNKYSTPNGKPVEYAENLNRVLHEIGLSIDDGTKQTFGYKTTDIVTIVFDFTDEHPISDKTYGLVRFMINRAASKGNVNWIKDYWTWASQYYLFRSNNINGGPHNPEMQKFYLFHVMFGAVLNFNQRYECLQHIISVCPNTTNKFPLIPGTFSNIVNVVKEYDFMLTQPMMMESRYSILGLYKGVNTDSAIFAETLKYLAILFVRLWSYDDYNINCCQPFETPQPSFVSIDENEQCIRIAQLLKQHITALFAEDKIKHLKLDKEPTIEEVIKKIDEYIDICKAQNEIINSQKGYSKDKLKAIFDDAVINNTNMIVDLPWRTEMDQQERWCRIDEVITGTSAVKRQFLHHGTSKECGGIGQGLAMSLNLNLKQTFYDILCRCYTVEVKTISYPELQDAIDELPSDNQILDFTNGIQYNTELKIFHVGRILINDAIFVCATADRPSCAIVDGDQSDDQLIDPYNFIYGSIYEQDSQYVVSIKQNFSVHLPQGKPTAVLFFIEYK